MLSVETRNWANRAICRYLDTNDFFPGRGESVNIIKVVCKACPVVKPCLEYAMRNSERFGVWGGTSERERRKMRASKAYSIKHEQEVTLSELMDKFGINITALKESQLDQFSGEDGYK